MIAWIYKLIRKRDSYRKPNFSLWILSFIFYKEQLELTNIPKNNKVKKYNMIKKLLLIIILFLNIAEA